MFDLASEEKGTFGVKGIRGRGWPVVTADGTGIVSHAGTALLRELAERSLGLERGVASVVGRDVDCLWRSGMTSGMTKCVLPGR